MVVARGAGSKNIYTSQNRDKKGHNWDTVGTDAASE
jgi:hypothetical protein